MAEDRMAVLDMLRKATADGDVDILREGVRLLAEAIMEAEVSELTGAAKGERAPDRRLTNRNGYRERRWDTRVGTIGLSIPKVRDGSYFPSLLEPRRRAERALLSVVQEAYVAGVSTRRVEDLVEALGVANLSRSEVSRICAALDAEVAAFRSRSLADERYPYLFCDATYVKVRDGGRVVGMAALVAVGVASTGERRILGLELAAGNDEGNAWAPFLRGLVERGLGRRPAGHQRCPPGPRRGRPRDAPRCRLAEMPGPLHPECPGARPAGGRRHGRLRHPEHLRAARRAGCVRAAPAGRRQPGRTLPGRCGVIDRGRARPARPLHLPRGPPNADPEHEPTGAAQQGDQAPDGGRRDLPDPGQPHPPRRDGPVRAGRRVAGRPALLQSGVDGRDRRRQRGRGGEPGAPHGELTDQARG